MKTYASGVTCPQKNEQVTLCLYGPRGGTVANVPLDINGARELVASLQDAINKYLYQTQLGRASRCAQLSKGK
jgi:hypothetical protein